MWRRSLACAAFVTQLGCAASASFVSTSDASYDTQADAGVADAATDDDGSALDGTVGDATTDGGGSACAPLDDASAPASVLFYTLRSGAFPDASAPSVAVHVPPGFDPSHRPGLFVFIHGFENCVANVVGDVDSPCTDGGAPRSAKHLAAQIDDAHVNALVVAIELEVDAMTGNPGQLATPGDFRALVHELLTEHLDAVIRCPLDVGDLDRVVVSSHSGGYEATANVLTNGGVDSIREVDLLDSLYGETDVFDGWMTTNIARFDPTRADGLRWMDVYTTAGGTAANSREMAASADGWLADAGLGGSELFDDTFDTLDAGSYAHPVLFKLSELAHEDVPKYYVGEFVRASGFATIP